MLEPEVRFLLVRCRQTLEHISLPNELDKLAEDLLDHLLHLSDAQRLTAPFLMLALESFVDVPELANLIGPLRRYAEHQANAEGFVQDTGSPEYPWVASSFADLEKGPD